MFNNKYRKCSFPFSDSWSTEFARFVYSNLGIHYNDRIYPVPDSIVTRHLSKLNSDKIYRDRIARFVETDKANSTH